MDKQTKVIAFPKASSQGSITAVFNGLRDVVLEKNRRYGDSALAPLKIFAKGDSVQGILVRLDDKLSRVRNSDTLRKNDVADIVGYLALLCVAEGWTDFRELVD